MIQETEPSPVTAMVADNNGPLAIQSNSLSKTYSEGLIFKKKFQALTDVSFDVRPGEVFGLLGPNGAGKTTFIKILLGIIRKSGGTASMLGYPAGSREGRKMVGYLPEHLRIPNHMTGFQALECYGNLSNVPTRQVKEKQGELLELVGLAGRAKDRVKKYSKGMLQRLGLAQALLHDPKLLVLDEPTDGLDPRARAEMRQTIRQLQKRGVTVFLNSHLLQEVEMICQRVAILDKGHLRYCGNVDQIGQFVSDLAGTSEEPTFNGMGNQDVVVIQIQGEPEPINRCFQGLRFEIESHVGDQFRVKVDLKAQNEVDELVDKLRAENISLISLDRKRVSLEDAFLQIVDEQSSNN